MSEATLVLIAAQVSLPLRRLPTPRMVHLSGKSPHRLPDQLRPHLRLVFVGTAASTRSAELGHYYAHPGNRFWRAIHEDGITPRHEKAS